VRQSVLFVDFNVSKSQTTNSANQQQKIIMSSYVICHSICSKKLDPFFTNETFDSSSHFGWSLMFGEHLKTEKLLLYFFVVFLPTACFVGKCLSPKNIFHYLTHKLWGF
jgi:hypothetical protein